MPADVGALKAGELQTAALAQCLGILRSETLAHIGALKTVILKRSSTGTPCRGCEGSAVRFLVSALL